MQTAMQFFRDYPRASLVTVFAFLFSGIAEGIGLLSLVPLLYLALGGDDAVDSATGGLMQDVEILDRLRGFFGDFFALEWILVAIFVGLTLKNYFLLLANRQIGITMARIAFDFRVRVLRSIYRSRWEYFVNQPAGYFSGRLTNEVKRAASTYMNSALLIAFVAQGITYLALAALVSPLLTVLALGVAVLAYAASSRFIAQSRVYGKRNTRYIKEIAKRAVESINGIKAIKAMGKEAFLEREFFKEIDSLRDTQSGQVSASERLKLWQSEIILFFMLLGLFASFQTSWVSPVEVLLLTAVLMRFFTQASKVSSQLQKVASSEAAYHSLDEFLQHAEFNREQAHGGLAPELRSEVEFVNVGFSYGEKQVLDNFRLTLAVNEITTLVGPSGAGKTTILDLLSALLEPGSGEIKVDGVALDQLDIAAWRKMIGYVPQDAFLLYDSIYNNVTLGDTSIDETEVTRALKEAHAMEFVSSLDGGMHFNVGERGSRLSGGQRQRIMIARALVNRPALLIFDEATSSLDADAEQEVCRTILELKAEHTIVCASHRPMLIDAADQVVVLGEGPSAPVGAAVA